MLEWKALESICVSSDEELAENLKINLERDIPHAKPLPERKDRLALVGAGPSVREYIDEIGGFDGHVWAINGAYDFLQDNGVVADGFLGCDPLPGLCDYLKRPHRHTEFYLAGTCHPTTIDAVADYDVKLWFVDMHIVKYPKGTWKVNGGTTALLRAPFLAWMLGYRDLTIYGADSSFDTEDRRYCYPDGKYQWDSKAPVNWVKTPDGQGPFPTEICLIKQVSQLCAFAAVYQGKMEFRCGGLMNAFLTSPMGNVPDGAQNL